MSDPDEELKRRLAGAREETSALGRAYAVTAPLLGGTLAGLGAGAWLDCQFGWRPWGLLGGLVVGVVLGFAGLLRAVKRFESDGS